jgi:hypothetical protein
MPDEGSWCGSCTAAPPEGWQCNCHPNESRAAQVPGLNDGGHTEGIRRAYGGHYGTEGTAIALSVRRRL